MDAQTCAEMVSAMTAASSPLARAVFLTMAAIQDEAWTCCHGDGSPAGTLCAVEGWRALRASTTLPATVEVHYQVGGACDNIVKVKWVPMDDTHMMVIAQSRDGSTSRQPVGVPLCTEEEPLASVMHGKTEWNAETLAAATRRLRPSLHDAFGIAQCVGTKGTVSAAQPPQEQQEPTNRPFECGPDRPHGSAPPAAQSLFDGVAPRPPGYRYGEGDLVPGGSLAPGSGMMLNTQAFRTGTLPQARYDPMFPGDVRGGRMWGPGAGRTFPGEPDPDLFTPPGGPAFGSAFGPGMGRGGGGGGMPPFLQ
ncbi:hypothetical protein DQ04_01741010 [Trypanosoma grayi]|uniref:hypothetical protein n=1 Tax=Trypanosoma grayi TaxID=71804 RepID=UPI0004F47E3F|nr:hypothetical protein DQ04_01741010 [Trypanosoma grayi]KEG12399.1 hypothetical protein DQ04_01741010 [Trypanosoma grayi]